MRRLQDFEGHWRLERRITHARQPEATLEGEAVWSAVPGGLLQEETGLLRIGTHPPMTTFRRYLWHKGLRVFFEDGRFFHQVPAEGGETRHWCDPDDYHVVYRFHTWPRFESIWRVKGPAKDYTMISRYRRL